jgi:phytanoyl-CoA dioxygenase PhyH
MNALRQDEIPGLEREYAQNGYLVFRNVVPKAKLSELRATLVTEFHRVRSAGQLFAGGGGISGHLNCYPGEEARFAYEVLRDYGILDLIVRLMPQAAGAPYVGMNFNLPGSSAQHYHPDGLFTEAFMVTNVAVVDTDLANGAIDVLPGTHREFYKYWRFALERAYRRSTRIPMQQGDVLIRNSNLWHRGMPNHTSDPRPMLALTFGENRGPVKPEDPFAVDGGRIAFQPNWFKPTLLGRVRERTFVRAPITYAAYRFVRSLWGNKGYAAW